MKYQFLASTSCEQRPNDVTLRFVPLLLKEYTSVSKYKAYAPRLKTFANVITLFRWTLPWMNVNGGILSAMHKNKSAV